MEPGTSPRKVTSKRSIKYKKSKWIVHEFEVWSGQGGQGGQLVCRAVALKMQESLLLWVGGAEPELGAVGLAMPPAAPPKPSAGTPLLEGGAGCGGAAVEAAALAGRAAAALTRVVFVCLAQPIDRRSTPLLELGIVAEMRRHPQYFYTLEGEDEAATPLCLCDVPLFETRSLSLPCLGNIDDDQSPVSPVKNENDDKFQRPK